MNRALAVIVAAAWLGACGEEDQGFDDEAGAVESQEQRATAEACGLALEWTADERTFLGGGRAEIQEPRPESVVQTGLDARRGTRSIRSALRYGEPQVAGGPRAETAILGDAAASRFRPGDSRYYGFSIRIPENWVDDGDAADILFQWKSIADSGEDGSSKSPHMYLGVKHDDMLLRITSDARRNSTASSPKEETEVLVPAFISPQARWHDFVVRVRWSYQADGDIRVWHKRSTDDTYRTVVNKSGPNMQNDAAAGYVKWGIYKPAWRQGPSRVSLRSVMHDNIRIGRSFGAVDPSRASCQP